MPEPTLTAVFGENATQTSTTITIAKSDLPGLTPSANNTAESLLVGILLRAQTNLTQAGFEADIDQSIYLTSGFPSFTARGNNNDSYRVDQFTINLSKPDTSGTIDPDDY